jgi:hypothetical protein
VRRKVRLLYLYSSNHCGEWGVGRLGDAFVQIYYPLSTIHYPLTSNL